MNSKVKKLPALFAGKTKTIVQKDRAKIEDLFMENAKNRLTHKDYRHQQEFTQMKASNFLSRIDTIQSPQVIFTVADQISQLAGSEEKENVCARGDGELKKNSSYKSEAPRVGDQRQQVINLAKWMQERLGRLRKKTVVTFMDILEYKQTILNFALGKIIDSLTKKCREEGQLLSLIWNNTFLMFEGVFNILVDANNQKEKQKETGDKELHEIFEVNHNFLKQEKAALLRENEEVFQKMKKVIIWNKRLRKDRKSLNMANRVLEYRNQTYSQALEQTVEMLLKTVPEPAAIQTAKKIVEKLAKEKHRRRHYFKKEEDDSFNKNTRQFVYCWLKRNNGLSEELMSFINEGPLANEEQFIIQDMEDKKQMEKVDIFDFFKLYDVGIQATVEMTNDSCQGEVKTYKSTEVMTRAAHMVEHGCQTASRNESIHSIDCLDDNRYRGSSQNKPSRLKTIEKDKKKKLKDKELTSNKSLKNGGKKPHTLFVEDDKRNRNKFMPRSSNRDFNRGNRIAEGVNRLYKDEDFINNPSVGFRFQEENNQAGLDEKIMSNSLISDIEEANSQTRGQPTTRHLITGHSLGSRGRSMHDIPDQEGSSKNFVNGLIRRNAKKHSIAYISDRLKSKSINRLNLKNRFADTFKENKDFMNTNREAFMDQIIRRRSFYGKKKVQFANFGGAEEATQKVRQYYRGKQWKSHHKPILEHSGYMTSQIQKLTKKISGPSNITKTKALLSSQALIGSIIGSIQEKARIPPNNKVFVNNSLSMIVKYIESLTPDYIRQVKRQKEELICEEEKVLYPLNILLMEQMTFKYGLKDIASKKIKNFVEKVLTFAPVSEKVELFSLLLGLEDDEVGSDELLVYIKCLVYFDCKKPLRDGPVVESSTVDIEIVRQNLRKVLEYFFDLQYVNLLELKLQIYFQQTAPFSTVEGIAKIIIRELLKRKKELKQKYLKIHELCSFGDNFFTNVFTMLKIVGNYQDQAAVEAEKNFNYSRQTPNARDSVRSIQALQKIKNRGFNRKKVQKVQKVSKVYDISKISNIVREMLQRSDIIDEQFGKSITAERFVTAAVIYGMPTFNQLEIILEFIKIKFSQLKHQFPVYQTINEDNCIDLDRLASLWLKAPVHKTEDSTMNQWNLAKLYSDKLQDEVFGVMGKIGTIGLYIESTLLNKCSSSD